MFYKKTEEALINLKQDIMAKFMGSSRFSEAEKKNNRPLKNFEKR